MTLAIALQEQQHTGSRSVSEQRRKDGTDVARTEITT
jgi:hypothetical protein